MARVEDGQSRRDIVVVGASAGGVEALVQIVQDLPASLGAAVFVVLHLPEGSSTALPDILDRAGALPAAVATGDAPMELGTITVAPPDHHLVLDDGLVRALKGPKVNGHRPAVDVLFHSAARSHGRRVVGVVLSGSLYDGTLGLRAIKRRGGAAIVQAGAKHEGMPTSALENVEVDAYLPVQGIAEALTMLVGTNGDDMTPDEPTPDSELEAGFDIEHVREAPSDPTIFRCPECGGAMWELEDGALNGYACHVGHTYSADSMLQATDEEVERALWTAVRMLEEKAALVTRLSERMREGGNVRSSARFDSHAREASHQAQVIRTVLEGSEPEPEAASG
jgi:two-component system chemotaxis response regulator CheB